MRCKELMRCVIHGAAVVTLLAAGLAVPAHADEEGAADEARPPFELNEVEKKVDLGPPPPEAAEDVALNSKGQAMTAEGGVSTKAKVNCGLVTCSLYLTRKETRYVAENGMAAAIAAGLIPKAGLVVSSAIGLATWKSQQAAKKKQCLRVRFGSAAGIPLLGIYSDGSKHCKK